MVTQMRSNKTVYHPDRHGWSRCWGLGVFEACRQLSLPRPSLDLPKEAGFWMVLDGSESQVASVAERAEAFRLEEEVAQIMKDVTSEQMEADCNGNKQFFLLQTQRILIIVYRS